MSEIDAPGVAAEPDVTASGFGRRLAAEREKRGLSIDDIAARLRLHPKQVKAIENEALPPLPAPFLRGFVRNYAKELRLDPNPLVAELNALLGPQAGESERRTSVGAGPGIGSPNEHGSRRVVLIGVVAVLVGLAVLGTLATRSDDRRAAAEAAKAVTALTPPSPAVVPAADAPKTEVVQPQAEQTPPLSATVAPAAPAPAEGLRLSFREQAWVEVTQSDGRVLHSQINEPGTEQRVDGKAPLRLVIGNASAVSLDYKGKPVDLKSATNAENVARITLN